VTDVDEIRTVKKTNIVRDRFIFTPNTQKPELSTLRTCKVDTEIYYDFPISTTIF